MAPAIRYQIDSRQLHHHRRRHQADGYDAGKRAHQAGTCENRQGRRYLLEEGIIDDEGFIEYISEL